jgi:hypothetical protein
MNQIVCFRFFKDACQLTHYSMSNLYNYDYQFRLIVVGDSTVGKVYLVNC